MDTPVEIVKPGEANSLTPSEALTRARPHTIEAGGAATAPLAHEEALFGFRVGSLGFLVEVGTSCEVLGKTQVNPIPNTPPWFSGLLDLRGNLAPAFDLRLWLDNEPTDPRKRSLFVIGREEKSVALWVDGLPEVMGSLAAPLAQLPPLPPALQAFALAAHLHRSQIWLKVQFEALFKQLGHQIATGHGG